MECTVRPAVLGDCPAITRLNREELGYDYPQEKTFAKLQACLANRPMPFLWRSVGERWWATSTWRSTTSSMPATW